MASGSTGRASNSGSKVFDLGSDDILCSYEDYGNQDGNNVTYSDLSVAANSAKEFQKSRMAARSSGFPPPNNSPPEDSSFNQDVISTVENTMKKYADNLMRFLEGISSRLSQLELYCYNVDKSIKEMRVDLVRDHGESESKLKSLEKHILEVHRAVQVLRDKQELADTQKELAKLQLAQKESSNPQQIEEKSTPPTSESKKNDNSSDSQGQQLSIALPQQVLAPQPSLPARPVAPSSSPITGQVQQQQPYYIPTSPQMTNLPSSHNQYLPSQINQNAPVQSVPPYQQQWAQQIQLPQQIIRPSSLPVYASYNMPSQPNQSPNSMPMQVSPEAMPYGYSATARPVLQPQSPQHLRTGYEAPPQTMDGCTPSGPRPALPPGSAYMMFDGQHPSHSQQQLHFQQISYLPPAKANTQRVPSGASMTGPQTSSMRSHPYNELIEKMVGMGYRGDHVVGVIQRLEESGQPVDFNAVLDRLNGHTSGGSQRGWSG